MSEVNIPTMNGEVKILTMNGEVKFKGDVGPQGIKGDKGEQGIQGIQGEQGIQGVQGEDAKINGRNTVNIVAGENIAIEQEGDTLTVNNTYDDSEIKQDIENIQGDVEDLETNKADRTELPTKTSDITNDSDFVSDANYIHTDVNFTNTDKQKLTNLENYDDTEIKSDINNLENNKANISDIPTKTSDLNNDSGFITISVNDLINYYLKTETYNKTEVNNLIGQIQTVRIEVVQTLPATGQSNVIYFVPKETPKTSDVYNEYIWTNNTWELIGSTQVDLTGYATETWVSQQIADFLTQSDIQTLIASELNNYYTKSESDGKFVEKETGKGLSTNDYTTTEKNKLTGIDAGAEVNTVDDVQVDGVSVVENKTANIDLSGKMDKNNAVGTGSFSINRRGRQGVGRNSVTLGEGCDASGEGAISMGYYNKVQGTRSAAIGRECDANNGSCYVIGKDLVTNNPNQTIIGNFNEQAPSNAVVLADGTSTNDTHNAIQITRSSGASSIDVNGNTVINGTATVNNTMDIAQGLTVGGNEVVSGNLNVSGISSFINTATFNSTLNAKYSGTTYNVGAKLAELSNLKEAKFSSKLMWNNNTVELKPGMVFLFPSDCSVTVTIVGRKGLKTNPVQTYTLNVQDLCGGICTEVGEADEDGKDSNYWRMFIGYRTGTLSFESDTYYISKLNTVTVTCNVAGGRWAYFISK